MCVSLGLQRYSFLFQKLENDKLMTAAFLKSGNVFPGSFFRIRPMENTWGQEPARQMCSLQTAFLSHKLHKEESWQLIGTNEPRIIISFKQIPLGLKFAVQKPICYLPLLLYLFIPFTSEQAGYKLSQTIIHDTDFAPDRKWPCRERLLIIIYRKLNISVQSSDQIEQMISYCVGLFHIQALIARANIY